MTEIIDRKENYAIVILAAGASSRFGSNKLLAEYKGKSLFCHILDKVKDIKNLTKVVVTGTEEIMKAGEDGGFLVVQNTNPEAGITHSLQLGVTMCQKERTDLDGILFCVCDQPELRRETIEEILSLAMKKEASIICAGNEKRRGNPVYFDKRYFGELLSLSGDKGGKQIIKRYPEELFIYKVNDLELFDVDTIHDLEIIS